MAHGCGAKHGIYQERDADALSERKQALFAGSILASILVAAMDMIAPQIIRIVVDGCLGEDLSRLPSLAQRTLAAVGGADYLREHLYLAAVGILLAAGISAVFQYLNTYLNTKGAESMVKTARDWLFHHH